MTAVRSLTILRTVSGEAAISMEVEIMMLTDGRIGG